MRVPLELQVVAFLHLWFYLSALRFRNRHVAQNLMQTAPLPRKAGFGLEHHGSSRVYKLWIVVCVLTSVRVKPQALWGLSRAHSMALGKP
eukprot:194253-Amphidinium_carterae.1